MTPFTYNIPGFPADPRLIELSRDYVNPGRVPEASRTYALNAGIRRFNNLKLSCMLCLALLLHKIIFLILQYYLKYASLYVYLLHLFAEKAGEI